MLLDSKLMHRFIGREGRKQLEVEFEAFMSTHIHRHDLQICGE